MSRTQRIKVWLNFVRAKPGDLRSRARAVFDGMKGNAGFPNPPFDLSKLGDQIERYGQLYDRPLPFRCPRGIKPPAAEGGRAARAR